MIVGGIMLVVASLLMAWASMAEESEPGLIISALVFGFGAGSIVGSLAS